MTQRSRTRVALLAAAVLPCIVDRSDAANKTWASAASDNWTNAAAWSSAGSPANGDGVLINQNSATNYLVNYDNPSTTQVYPLLVLNNSGGGAAQMRTAGGTVYNITTATVGGSGLGFWQIGGATANVGALTIGSAVTSGGTVTLSTGTLHATNDLTIGSNGSGAFAQSGGISLLDNELLIGASATGNGVVTLSGGSMTVAIASIVGNFGSATFTQTSGVHTTPHLLILPSGGNGIYNLQGGTLNVGSMSINGNATFNQSAGSVTADQITLGAGSTYNFSGGVNLTGTFSHNGGTVVGKYHVTNGGSYVYNSGTFLGELDTLGSAVFNADITIGGGWNSRASNVVTLNRTVTLNGPGLYHKEGTLTQFGNINSTSTRVGGANAASTATINQQGGIHTVANELRVGDGSAIGTYNLNNGTLNMAAATIGASIGVNQPGFFSVGNGRLNVSQLRVGQGAVGTFNHTGTGDVVATGITVGSLSAGTYIQNNAAASVTASNGLIIGSLGRYNLSAGTLASGQTANNGSFTQTGGVANLNQISGTGRMDITNNASLSVDRIRQDFLFIADTARIFTSSNGGATGVSRLNTLFFEDFENLNFFGKWDLNNNDLVVDSDAGTQADEYDRTRRYIVSGFANGSWNGNGLNSSAAIAAATTLNRTGLGYARAADVLAFSGGTATFVGQVVDDTTVLVRYTLLGDSDLNGVVDIGDFAFLAPNFNDASDWRTGDYTYDGVTNLNDFAFLASNFNKALAADLPRGAAVPEPAMGTAVAMFALLGRRRIGERR